MAHISLVKDLVSDWQSWGMRLFGLPQDLLKKIRGKTLRMQKCMSFGDSNYEYMESVSDMHQ